ncbi:GTP pyrophosphokinase [Arthrobacter psychrochitiniphilus]|uniref:GTP pyrophosphokinase n=1 Tax=Arthrobacter psychrochitiniphilus TaxID=291045 RepID=UPI003F7C6770
MPARHELPLETLKMFRTGIARFMLSYQFGIDEMMTKINILKSEFEHLHDYSPIEHVSSRLKTPESILAKISRDGMEPSFAAVSESIHDIAGIRITCSFISDVYRVAEMISSQRDVTVLRVKDYIASPKANGYKSLHLIVSVPVFLSASVETVSVEIQIRTIAMDFWASLEHKIYYKFDEEIPAALLQELQDAARVANNLDVKMERIHEEVLAVRHKSTETDEVSD